MDERMRFVIRLQDGESRASLCREFDIPEKPGTRFWSAMKNAAWNRKKINLSTSLAGQAVGVKEVDHGIWLVSFMHYDLGYIDLEEKTLQPLENPFWPKVLPMS